MHQLHDLILPGPNERFRDQGGTDARAASISDRDPAPLRLTGRGRLSYERAEYLFKRHSRRISRNGLTLHQLRHSALTTLADANVSLPLLMGKSRHKSLRSLQRYVHPSAEAVAAMTAAHDPAARRRQY